MNLQNVEKIYNSLLKVGLGFDIDIKYDENLITAAADLQCKGIDDGVFLKIGVFDSSAFFITFVLDKLDYSSYVSKLIFDFNAHSKWLNCFIREDGYLVVEYAIRFTTEEILEDNITFILNEFVQEDIQKYLKPLTELTKAE